MIQEGTSTTSVMMNRQPAHKQIYVLEQEEPLSPTTIPRVNDYDKTKANTVHWNCYEKIIPIIHVNDMTKQEIGNTWYTKCELKSFRVQDRQRRSKHHRNFVGHKRNSLLVDAGSMSKKKQFDTNLPDANYCRWQSGPEICDQPPVLPKRKHFKKVQHQSLDHTTHKLATIINTTEPDNRNHQECVKYSKISGKYCDFSIETKLKVSKIVYNENNKEDGTTSSSNSKEGFVLQHQKRVIVVPRAA